MLASVAWILEGIQRTFLGSTAYIEFGTYLNTKEKYDNDKATAFISKVTAVLMLATFYFSFGARIVLRPDTFTIKRINDIVAHTYGYHDVTKVIYYRSAQNGDGTLYPHAEVRIYFSDMVFKTSFYFSDIESTLPFISELSKRSNKPIDTIAIAPYKD